MNMNNIITHFKTMSNELYIFSSRNANPIKITYRITCSCDAERSLR